MGSKLMRVSRGWGMIWIMEVLTCLLVLQVCCLEQIDLSAFPWVHGQGGDWAKVSGTSGGLMLRVLPVNLMNRYLAGQLHNNEGERPGGRLMG